MTFSSHILGFISMARRMKHFVILRTDGTEYSMQNFAKLQSLRQENKIRNIKTNYENNFARRSVMTTHAFQ